MSDAPRDVSGVGKAGAYSPPKGLVSGEVDTRHGPGQPRRKEPPAHDSDPGPPVIQESQVQPDLVLVWDMKPVERGEVKLIQPLDNRLRQANDFCFRVQRQAALKPTVND